MTYSLCLSYVNARHFHTPIDIFGNFLPGMIFFQSIFGYLVFTIIFKWSTDWYAVGQSPPSLLNMLIYMFLKPGEIEGEPMFGGQAAIQVILVFVGRCTSADSAIFEAFILEVGAQQGKSTRIQRNWGDHNR